MLRPRGTGRTRQTSHMPGCRPFDTRQESMCDDALDALDARGGATADDLRPGIDVRAQRFDSDEIDSMAPPPVRGTDVAIRCSN